MLAWFFLAGGGLAAIFAYLVNGAFPQPLKPEKEKEFLRLMYAGNEWAEKKLIEHNLRLVAHVAKRFDGPHEDTEDLISIGTIGLIKAIKTYDDRKKTRLATYAARCIENEILMYLRASKKIKNEMFLYEPIGADKEGNEITLIDVLGTPPEEVGEKVEGILEQEKLYQKLGELDSREKEVLILRYGLGNSEEKTQREIARTMGISRSYVSRIEKKAIQKLSRKFSVEGYL